MLFLSRSTMRSPRQRHLTGAFSILSSPPKLSRRKPEVIKRMGNERKCVVSFRDQEGVEHVAEVIAESLYEAGALALQQFRRGEWSREASLDTGALRVEVCESTFYTMCSGALCRVAAVNTWHSVPSASITAHKIS